MTGDPIKFSSDGRLLDGQHRLEACEIAGLPISTHVVFGVDPGAFTTIDTGRSRSASDALAIEGVRNYQEVAGALRFADFYIHHRRRLRGLSPARAVERIKGDWSGIAESALVSLRMYDLYGHSKGHIAGFHFVLSSIDPDKASAFFDAWFERRRDGSNRVVANMQTALVRISAGSGLHRPDYTLIAATMTNGWNSFFAGRAGTVEKMIPAFGQERPTLLGIERVRAGSSAEDAA